MDFQKWHQKSHLLLKRKLWNIRRQQWRVKLKKVLLSGMKDKRRMSNFLLDMVSCGLLTEALDFTWSSISFRTDSHMIWRHLMIFPRRNLPLKSCKRTSKKSRRGEMASTVGKDSGDQARWKMCFFMAGWSCKKKKNESNGLLKRKNS